MECGEDKENQNPSQWIASFTIASTKNERERVDFVNASNDNYVHGKLTRRRINATNLKQLIFVQIGRL